MRGRFLFEIEKHAPTRPTVPTLFYLSKNQLNRVKEMLNDVGCCRMLLVFTLFVGRCCVDKEVKQHHKNLTVNDLKPL